jgi:hypothetical protein
MWSGVDVLVVGLVTVIHGGACGEADMCTSDSM